MTDDNGTDLTQPSHPVEPVAAAEAVEQTAPAPAAEAAEPTVLAGQPAAAARKAPWQMWAAVAVGVVLLLAIGARATFGFARFVAFHGHRAGYAATSVQRFDPRHRGGQMFRRGGGLHRGGGRVPLGRG